MKTRTKITIEIDNLTEPQRLAIEDLLATWESLGGVGGSRWTAFFADGDGDFRPRITVNGKKPDLCRLTDPKKRWKVPDVHEMYMLDFDEIAWAMVEKAPKTP